MASLVIWDLDLEDDLSKVYAQSQETIKYLQDVTKSIENRVIGGEKIQGLKVVKGKKTRFVTDPGKKYLEKVLGEEVFYEITKKPLGITKLEILLSKEEIEDLTDNGYIAYQDGKEKVVVE